MSTENKVGSIHSIWRYPVKSMMGESLDFTQIKEQGLWGDRSYALIDRADGKVVTAKNPKKWPTLFSFQAALTETLSEVDAVPSVQIKLDDGTSVTSDRPDIDAILSKALKRDVTLAVTENLKVRGVQSGSAIAHAGSSEEFWPDIEGRSMKDVVTDFNLPTGTFFDCANVHLLTTSTLAKLKQQYPQGRFEIPRFRPNMIIDTLDQEPSFAENEWVGRTVAIGEQVLLKIFKPCPRCVMTTLPQGNLPRDNGILYTAVKYNQGHVGVYATVLRGGEVRLGDAISIER